MARACWRNTLTAAVVAAALGGGAVLQVVTAPAALAAPPTLAVDLASSTGAFFGGASGALYGLAQDGVPDDDVVAPLHIRTIAQKPDGGAQHPSGDATKVAPSFFRNGGVQEFIYMQDLYTYFPYENPGIASYQQSIAPIMTSVVASPYRTKFVYVPFNEPDNIWYDLHSGDPGYAASRDKFFQDWKAVFAQIRQADPGAKIAGPNTASYDSTFIRQFLTFAKANNVLPDVMTWHELLDGWTVYRGHFADYRTIEQQVGVSARPINIDEYAWRSDQSVPGKMIQWMAGFEDTKVDAMQAFWGITEDIQGNVVRANEANASWWLMRWYGAMTGNTVKVTPPNPNTQDTVQAIATLDTAKKQARVVLGGGGGTTTLAVSGVANAVFGGSVHVQVQRTRSSGWESTAATPATIAEGDYAVSNGSISVTLPDRNADDAYQVILTPSSSVGSLAPTSPPAAVRYEAEDAAITAATVYQHGGLIDYPSSGTKNVGSFNQSSSRITYTVTAPVTGQYQLDVLYGSQADVITRQIMRVDAAAWQYVSYPPTLNFSRNGKKTLYLPLTAGTHTITFGVSDPSIGNTASDITQDAIDLTALTAATTTTRQIAQRYDAEYADITGSSNVATAAAGYTGTAYVDSAPASQAGNAIVVVNVTANGYYDVSSRYRVAGTTAAAVTRRVDEQIVSTTALPATNGAWSEATQTLWLKAGINRLRYSQAVGAVGFGLDRVDVTPVVGDVSALAPTREAESGAFAGTAAVQSDTAASGGAFVNNVGNGTANTLTLSGITAPRAGVYAVNVSYANNERPNTTTYNTDLVDRFADVTTTTGNGSSTQRVFFKNTSCWSCFQQRTFYVTLTAGTNSLRFANATAAAPYLDAVQVAAVVQPTSTVEAEAPGNTRGGTVVATSAGTASNGTYVGFVGNGAANTLTVTGLSAAATGTGTLLVRYASGDTRTATLTVNGGSPVTVTFPSTGSFVTWADLVVRVPLTAGSANSVVIGNSSAFAPDIDKVGSIG